MFMIMYVSKDVEQASEMLDVWVKAGVKGVTILESAGMQQVSEQSGGIRADLGITFSLNKLLRATEIHHRTLFSAVSDQETVDKVVAASTAYIKDWSRPDVGVLFILPMITAYGIEKSFK
jgi:nitrogen regulatory protein PII